MKLFLLLLLCCICSGEECRPQISTDVLFTGFSAGSGSFSAVDPRHCQMLCSQHHTCRFFSFFGDSLECQLRTSDSGSPLYSGPLKGAVSGFSLKPCAEIKGPCLPDQVPNVAFSLGDYRSLFTPDAEDCHMVCTSDDSCTHWSWISSEFLCQLKFSWPVPRPELVKTRRTKYITGFSGRADFSTAVPKRECPTEFLQESDFRAGASQVSKESALSPEHCQALCAAHPQCTHFTLQGVECFLLQKKDSDFTRGHGITSGVSPHNCHSKAWLKQLFPGVYSRDPVMEKTSANDELECQKKCTENLFCQFFTFNTSNKECNLKRTITVPVADVKVAPGVVSGFSQRGAGESCQ